MLTDGTATPIMRTGRYTFHLGIENKSEVRERTQWEKG
jgi:hypothetical protein